MRKACLRSSGVFAETLGARGGDEFGLHGVEHPFAHQAGDFAGEIKAQRDRRQNHVQRRFPQRHRQPVPFDRKNQDQQRRDDEARNADGEHGQKTAGIILPAPAPGRGEKTERQARRPSRNRTPASRAQGDRQALRDDVVDGMVAVLERNGGAEPIALASPRRPGSGDIVSRAVHRGDISPSCCVRFPAKPACARGQTGRPARVHEHKRQQADDQNSSGQAGVRGRVRVWSRNSISFAGLRRFGRGLHLTNVVERVLVENILVDALDFFGRSNSSRHKNKSG